MILLVDLLGEQGHYFYYKATQKVAYTSELFLPTNQPTKQPTNKLCQQPTKQPTNQPTDQNQPTN